MNTFQFTMRMAGNPPIPPRSLNPAIWHLAFGLLQCLCLYMMTGCAAPAPAAKFIVQADRFHEGALKYVVVQDSDLTEYVQEVGSRLVAGARLGSRQRINDEFAARLRCHLIVSDSINAFSTGGTHVYITTALFQQCEGETELAAALAHAYSHLMNLDLEQTRMQPDANAPLSMVAWQFVTNRFTLDQERKADMLAINLYAASGWDPNRFTSLFEHLESISGGNVAPDRQSLPERAALLQTRAIDMQHAVRKFPVADPRTFKSLRQRAARFHDPLDLPAQSIFIRAFPNCILSGDTRDQREAQERLRPLPPAAVQKLEPN